VAESKLGNWRLCADTRLIERVCELRAKTLPCETGGVLVGAFDTQRRVVYVVDTVPSPPDSEEWPNLYIRGAKGLASKIRSIEATTLYNLRYVGEWHSHPDGSSSQPSTDDLKALDWLSREMNAVGLPALMAIVGESPDCGWFIKEA